MTDLQVSLNQQVEESQTHQKANLRSYSQCVVCPNCKKIGFSRADQKCNPLNFVFAFFCFSCWLGWQTLKHKDLTCYDAEHSCTYCNQPLANYNACSDEKI
jgi:hypothetical protein